MYFPDRGCVHTLLTLYVYATGYRPGHNSGHVVHTDVKGTCLLTALHRVGKVTSGLAESNASHLLADCLETEIRSRPRALIMYA